MLELWDFGYVELVSEETTQAPIVDSQAYTERIQSVEGQGGIRECTRPKSGKQSRDSSYLGIKPVGKQREKRAISAVIST